MAEIFYLNYVPLGKSTPVKRLGEFIFDQNQELVSFAICRTFDDLLLIYPDADIEVLEELHDHFTNLITASRASSQQFRAILHQMAIEDGGNIQIDGPFPHRQPLG